MADQGTLEAIETAELILQVDGIRAIADPFKLPTALQSLVSTRLTACKSKNAAATLMEGSTVGAAQQRQQALDKLTDLLHSGYNFIASVPSDDMTDAERAQVFASYGWENGLIGDLSQTLRIEELANAAITATADPGVPAQGKYSATLVSRITNWLGIFDAASAIANGGSRQVLIQQRNDARDLLAQADSRVRLAYCSASDDGESTPELAKIGMQPKRAPGEAQPQPLPESPGAATFNNVTRELTIPEMPAHATFLRAYRQPAGGSPIAAGVSTTTSVSVVGISPLTPGVVYEAWVVGANSRGEGAESNKISFTA